MRNELPYTGLYYRDSEIINLDDASGPGTHWVAYRNSGNEAIYLDSFSDLQLELIVYANIDTVKYNPYRFQDYDLYNCGHLCLKFLSGKLDCV